MFARTSDHCPNFCDVFVKVIFGVIVEFMTACEPGKGARYKIEPLCKNSVKRGAGRSLFPPCPPLNRHGVINNRRNYSSVMPVVVVASSLLPIVISEWDAIERDIHCFFVSTRCNISQ